MAVRIRLTRVGATKRPSYRVIAIDRRRSRDGRALEILGFYDPLTDPATVKLDTERINAWIGKGAQPSDTVAKLIRLAAQPPDAVRPKPKRATRAAKPKAAAKASPAATKPATDSAEALAAADAPAAEAPMAEAPAEAEAAPAVEDTAPESTEAATETAADSASDEPAEAEPAAGDTTERAEA